MTTNTSGNCNLRESDVFRDVESSGADHGAEQEKGLNGNLFTAEWERALYVLMRGPEAKYGPRRNTCFTLDAAVSNPLGDASVVLWNTRDISLIMVILENVSRAV